MDRHKLAVTNLSMMRNNGEVLEQRTESTTSDRNLHKDGYMSIGYSD